MEVGVLILEVESRESSGIGCQKGMLGRPGDLPLLLERGFFSRTSILEILIIFAPHLPLFDTFP